jgi:hypothetical protein
MTEQDLIDLGFIKVDINDSESQNGYDYHYYNLEVFDNLTLSSVDSDEVKDDQWFIYNLDWPLNFKISDKEQVIQFLEILHCPHQNAV